MKIGLIDTDGKIENLIIDNDGESTLVPSSEQRYMDTDGEICKPRNKTPMIYTGGDFIKSHKTGEFIKELAGLYNKYNIDTILNTYDFLLAEMTYNFLAVISNTIKANENLKED